MGQGGSGDQPNCEGDRDGAQRQADDEDAEDAEQTVQRALAEARDARDPDEYETGGGPGSRDDDTGSTDPESIRKDFGVNVRESNTRRSPETNSPFQTLTPGQRSQLKESLTEKHGKEAVESVYSRLESWKKGSGNMSVSQPYERLARDALGIEANVRGGGTEATEPTADEIAVYRDLNRVSRAFLRSDEEYGDRFTVHRGVRSLNASIVAAQAIDDPNRDEFYFPTSTISNHTTLEEDAERYSSGVLMSWEATPDDVALAIDHVFDTPRTEGEMHMKGGIQIVDGDDSRHTPTASGATKTVTETAALMNTPESLSVDEHRDVGDLVSTVANNGVRLRNEASVGKTKNWVEKYEQQSEIPAKEKRAVRTAVRLITLGSDEERW